MSKSSDFKNVGWTNDRALNNLGVMNPLSYDVEGSGFGKPFFVT